MSLKIDGVEPTTIKYNGTDLTSLEMGSTAVWGKPFSLTLTVGSNVTLTVKRTSSPNQNASTGNLSNGSLVYYGDVLQISASASTNYKISTFVVNNTNFTSGNTITVTSAVNVSVAAVQDVYWRTVWTGSIDFGISEPGDTSTGNRSTSKSVTISGVLANKPTRITFDYANIRRNYKGSTEMDNGYNPNGYGELCCGIYTNQSVVNQWELNQSNGRVPPIGSVGAYCFIDKPTSNNTVNVRHGYYVEQKTEWFTKYYRRTWYSSLRATKVEQYY